MSAFRPATKLVRHCSELPESAIPASKALHAALRTNVLEGLTAVMGRMFTSGSNAQVVNFANPAFQWPQPGSLAAMQQPQAALRRACSYQ